MRLSALITLVKTYNTLGLSIVRILLQTGTTECVPMISTPRTDYLATGRTSVPESELSTAVMIVSRYFLGYYN
jgi:hypothetical protein